MEVLVQDELGIARELLDAAAQVNATQPRSRERARVPTYAPGVLDEVDAFDLRPESFDERTT